MKDIMVSISCITYNHENFIKEALDSILMQETNFNYEILIHDDASTDSTPDIIKEYEEKYPDLIKPIYQKNNQYSKGIKVNAMNVERALGKYIAICEGDDYWTNPHKLQEQFDYMQDHPECSVCVHAGHSVNLDSKVIDKPLRPNNGNKIYNIGEIISGGGGLFATNSIFYRRELCLERPKFFNTSPVGDYPLIIYLSLKGSVYYVDKFMSTHRINVPGSWTKSTLRNFGMLLSYYERTILMLNELDEYTRFEYNKVIKERKNKMEFNIHLLNGNYKDIRKTEYKDLYNTLKLTTLAKYFFIRQVSYIKSIKSIIRKIFL